jgi:Protein of unknown function (DUF541)
MQPRLVVSAAVIAAVAAAGIAFAKGPPPAPVADPPPFTVTATDIASSGVNPPARRADATIERAVQAARRRAIPLAVAGAREEALALAAAAGLRLGEAVSVRRDVAPMGYWDQESGRFGPGRWCGQIWSRRVTRRADGSRRVTRRSRHGCEVPGEVSMRVTMTFAAGGA